MERPHFATVKEYGKHFMDGAFWRPYVEAICARCELSPCREIRAGLPGTFPVFIVDGRYVVKLFGELFNGSAGFAVELELYQLLATEREIPAPACVASGMLFPAGDGWSWPFIITRMLPGESLSEVEERVSYQDKLAVCRWLGPVVRRIHELRPGHSARLQLNWEAFDHFLSRQKASCVENHRQWGSLPERLVVQLEEYIPPVVELADRSVPPHVLHCDLNADHVLGYFEEEHWRPAGIIDFGDAMVGDQLYDLVALHIGLFRCDKRLLRAFLEAYGSDEGLRRDFVRRAMSMTLLHQFNVLGEVFRASPVVRNVATLDELAGLIWGMDGPGDAPETG